MNMVEENNILVCDFCREKNNNVIPLFECDDYSPLVCLTKCYVDYFYIKYYHYIINKNAHLTEAEKDKIRYWLPEPSFYLQFKDMYIRTIETKSHNPEVIESIERFKNWHNNDLMERLNKKWLNINQITLGRTMTEAR